MNRKLSRRGVMKKYAEEEKLYLPPMGVTVYGRPQGLPNGNASLELTVHHMGGIPTVHKVNLWDTGEQLAHQFVNQGRDEREATRGILADWVDENSEHFQSVPREYKQYLGQLIRRGHRWPPEPPVQMSRTLSFNTVKRYAEKPFGVPARQLVTEHPGRADWMETKSPTKAEKAVLPNVGKSWQQVKVNKNLLPVLAGSRLAVVLHEIRDHVAQHDLTLKKLADMGLRGVTSHNGQDLFTQIRNRLLSLQPGGTTEVIGAGDYNLRGTHADRAKEIAESYNWHRVGAGLNVDESIAEYVNKIAKQHLKDRGEQFRAAHNLFGIGSESRQGAKPGSREAFWKGLVDHVKKQAVGPNSIYGLSGGDINEKMLLRSLRRLAENEEEVQRIGTHRDIKPETKLPANPTYAPTEKAWTPAKTKEDTGSMRSGARVSPRARANQFRRKALQMARLPSDYNTVASSLGNNHSQGSNPAIFADYLQENELPGANIAREHTNENGAFTNGTHGFVSRIVLPTENTWKGDEFGKDGIATITYDDGRKSKLGIESYQNHHIDDSPKLYYVFSGHPYATNPNTKEFVRVSHRARIHSLQHLQHLLADYPEKLRQQFTEAMRREGLPDTHESQQMSRRNVIKYGILDTLRGRDTSPPVMEGIRHTSHPNGKYDENSHMAAMAEHNALRHRLEFLRLLPGRKLNEDFTEYGSRTQQDLANWMDRLRKHVHDNINDPESYAYLQAANKFNQGNVPMGILDLSSKLDPLVKRISGYESPHSRGRKDETGLVDLNEAHNASEEPEIGEPIAEELPSALPMNTPRQPRNVRQRIYQDIANHEEQGWSSEYPSAVDMLKDKHGMSHEEAVHHVGNYRRLKGKPVAQQPTPTKRVWPPEKRMSRRRFAAGKTRETGDTLRETAFRLNDELDIGPDYQRLFWNPKTKVAWYVTADGDEESEVKKIRNVLENVAGVDHVRVEAEYFPPDDDSGWVEMYDRNNPDEGWIPWPPKKKNSRRRFAAYRAPSGGMIVRGSHYKGGEMIPDMKSDFMNPPIKMQEGEEKWTTDTPDTQEKGFHDSLFNSSDDLTGRGAYADWLEEQGKLGLAKIVRDSDDFIPLRGPNHAPLFSWFRYGVNVNHPELPANQLITYITHRGDNNKYFRLRTYVAPHEIGETLRNLKNEGVELNADVMNKPYLDMYLQEKPDRLSRRIRYQIGDNPPSGFGADAPEVVHTPSNIITKGKVKKWNWKRLAEIRAKLRKNSS